jgi:glycosyltransferase involved in cell wall biosynthesis
VAKTRVLYVVRGYPQISQTYIKNELEAVWGDYDVSIVSLKPPDLAYSKHFPYRRARTEEVREIVEEVRPDVIHTHYLNQLPIVGPVALATGTPFTVRAHSFDVLVLRHGGLLHRVRERVRPGKAAKVRGSLGYLSEDLCLGALVLPFTRPLLEAAGVPVGKLVDCWPVIAYDRFHNRGPNGTGVMNTGAAIPKKSMEDFIELAAMVPQRAFRLYALGYRMDELRRANERAGGRVAIDDHVEPDDMPREYKRHAWLVYTGSFKLAAVGWPMAVAEAQAAGVGVCVPRLRPDLEEYVGGAGFLYDSIEKAAEIIRKPVPPEIREAGFEQAKKSDIARHKHLLTDLWDKAGGTATAELAAGVGETAGDSAG